MGLAHMRILIVEDDLNLLMYLDKFLTNLGAETIMCDLGRDAVRVAEEQNVDTMILNIGLPDANGYEICMQIKSNPKTENIKVILTTGSKKSARLDLAYVLGAEGFITKPIDLSLLIKLVNGEDIGFPEENWPIVPYADTRELSRPEVDSLTGKLAADTLDD